MTDSRPLVPTSSRLVPDEAVTTSSLVPPLKEGRGRGVQKGHLDQADPVPRPDEVKGTRQDALANLMQRIFEHEQFGRLIPCVNPKLAEWWLSEDVQMQEAAALACSTCPALRNCREYVEQWPENGGVWAGVLPPRRGVRNSARDRLSRGDRR